MKFFKEVRSELRKTTWLKRKEAYKSTVAVLITAIVIACLFVVADFGVAALQDLIK